ncbi:c-type cytochrome [Luteolibacter luteus]|uniref:Cytochrome c n=1 Tax=Luteolibacter luteus TaxID=2728835 RepID=A0A858RJH0_9BACT|nr:cytochrome c [Luteolibacter luteus]QJE97416.1 cytochrome c [Luteolibacter luteus]
MSSSSDNPFVRFTAFWWALGVFSLFGVLLLVTKLFTSDTEESNPLEEAAAAKRYEMRTTVDAAQAAGLGYKEVEKGKVVQVPPTVVFKHVGETLLAGKPEAVKQDTQIIPGGSAVKTGGDADYGAVDKLTPAADTPVDPAAMEAGKAAFMICMACHGANGEGGPVGPPLANNPTVAGPVSNLIRIQFRGLTGPIHVGDKEMNFPAPMMPVIAAQDDAYIANVLTYVRNSFGNKAGPVLPEQVKMLRSEIGKAVLTEADLIKH